MRGSLVIVGFFVAGIIVGVLHLIPQFKWFSNVSYITLCALIFLVGFMIGNDAEIFKNATIVKWKRQCLKDLHTQESNLRQHLRN